MNLDAMLVLGLVVILPLVLALVAPMPAIRRHALSLLPLAPLPGLLAALFAPAGTTLAAPGMLLGATLVIDGHGRIFLGFVALLWIAAGLFVRVYMRDAGRTARFAACWCLTLAGNLGVFITGDVVSFYAAFACVSLAAYPLVVHERSVAAMRAGRVYIVLAIIGETCLLLGFMLGAADATSLLIADIRDAIAVSPARNVALPLLVAGFGVKAGLVPLHVWLPLAHPAAPTPASAVLSGAIVKAGVFGLMQFLPFGIALPGWHDALVTAGLATAFFGIAVGLTQTSAKTILAYSTVSQMGLVAAVLASALREGAPEIALAGATLYALHHGLAKGALFMGVGVMAGRGTWMLAILAVPALSIAGFALTGGALAKLAIKPSLGGGMIELLVTLSAIGTSLLLLRFLLAVAAHADCDADRRPMAGLLFPWLLTIASALVLPWALFEMHSGEAVTYPFSSANLWSASWPLIVAAVVAAIAWRTRLRAPHVPEGDLLAAVGPVRGWFPARPGAGRLHASLRGAFDGARDRALELATDWPARAEQHLSRWSVSGTLVLVLVLLVASCRA